MMRRLIVLSLVLLFLENVVAQEGGVRGNVKKDETPNPFKEVWLEMMKEESFKDSPNNPNNKDRALQSSDSFRNPFDRVPPSVGLDVNPIVQQQSSSSVTNDITVGYVSNFNTTTHVSVPVPYKDALTMANDMQFDAVSGESFLAIRGTEVGVHTVFYDVRMDLHTPWTLYDGTLNPNTQFPVQSVFRWSPWVNDDLSRLVPEYIIDTPNGVLPCLQTNLEREVDSVAHQSFRLLNRCGSMVLEFWIHVFDLQDVLEWELFAVFSDPGVTDMEITINSLDIRFGEYVHVDDKVPLGIPATTYDINTDKWTSRLVSGPQVMGDAQGLPIFKGALLCMDNSASWAAQVANPAITSSTQFLNMLYRIGGWILTSRDWTDRWLAFQATIPQLSQDANQLDSIYNNQWNFMQSQQDLYEKRKLGLLKYAGSTGGQLDFGSQKGSAATMRDLRIALTWHYHLQEAMRPIHYKELNGEPTTGPLQPGWVTWSQKTHWHCSVSPNRLGKICPIESHTTHGWSGKDDQHKSSNALNAAIAHFDWPAWRAVLRDEINVALENVRFLPGQSEGGVRAVGRRMLADANAYLLTGLDEVWEGLVTWHAANAFVKSEAGPVVQGTTFRAQGLKTNNKPPFIPDPATGNPVPTMVVWEHGLLMKGLTGAWSTHLYRQSLGLPTVANTTMLETLISEIAITYVRHCFAQVGGNWQTWNLIAWKEGTPWGAGVIGAATDTPNATQQKVTVTNSWWSWIFPGFYYLARANHGIALPTDVVTRLNSMATEWETTVYPGSDIRLREWFPFTDSTL